MDVFNIFNKASQKITDYFSFINQRIQNPKKEIQDSLIQINSKIFIWIKDSNFKDDDFIQVIRNNFKDNYMIYNLLSDKIETETSPDKIIDFKLPNNPSFSLESIISFCISSKNWLNANEQNILVIHDDISKNDGNIFYLISTIIAYNKDNNTKNKNEIKEPAEIYIHLLEAFENHIHFKKLPLNNNAKNNIRYLNYFSSIQKSPLITLKKMQLNNVIISGAPAIDNEENNSSAHYITIDKNSFYVPVLRIKSNGKFIYSSYNPKDKDKNKLNKIFYSSESAVKFDINQICFNDVCIEVMHKGEKSFRLLFTIQFNTFFINSNYSIKFSKEQIDSINQDIRYPNDFHVDLIFDSSKEEKLSPFDDYSIVWKTMLGEFIVKGLSKSKNNKNENNNNEIKNITNKSNIQNSNKENTNNKDNDIINKNIVEEKDKKNDKEIKINEEVNENKINNENKNEEIKDDKKEEKNSEKQNEIKIDNKDIKEDKEDKDDDILNSMGNTNNTLNQVNNLLKQIEGENGDNNDKDEQEDDEDIENYLKDLENK